MYVLTRQDLERMVGGGSPVRDIDESCRYLRDPQIADYQKAFDTNGVAARVVEILPDECWRLDPTPIEVGSDTAETPWEKQVRQLVVDQNIWNLCHRADVQSRIGQFGVILLGFNDGGDLSTPVPFVGEGKRKQTTKRQLMWTQVYSQTHATISKWEKSPTSPRYGLPLEYKLTAYDPETNSIGTEMTVHWTRCIHLLDLQQSSAVYGNSALRRVYNWVHTDLRKLAGGAIEMFWQGAFPGLFISIDPKAELTPEAEAEIKAQLAKYSETLQRTLTIQGAEIHELRPQTSNPSAQFELLMQLCAISIGCPLRVFMGTEEGKLASGQDAVAWSGRVHRRREKHCGPKIVKPLIDRLIDVGVLDRVEYSLDWPTPNNVSDAEVAETMERICAAIANYIRSGADQIIPPESLFEEFLGWDHDQTMRVLNKAHERAEDEGLLAIRLLTEQQRVLAAAKAVPDPNAQDPQQEEDPSASDAAGSSDAEDTSTEDAAEFETRTSISTTTTRPRSDFRE
jgi:uncharacterized protein